MSNPLNKIRISNLRTSQQMWDGVKQGLMNEFYKQSLLRNFYKAFIENAISSGALIDGQITQEETDAILPIALQVLPTDNPDTPFVDESMSLEEFIELHNRYLDPDAPPGTWWIKGELLNIENPEASLNDRLASVADEMRKILGLSSIADGEIDAIDSEIKDLELVQENENRSI